MSVTFISEKVSYSLDKEKLRIVILGKIPRWQESLLGAWLLAWTFCGVYFVLQLFDKELPGETRLAIWILLSFWIYFFYKITRTYLFRKFGSEVIQVSRGQMHIKQSIKGYGKAKDFFAENVRNLRKIEVNPRAFSSFYEQSFWILGGQRLRFDYLGSAVVFGMQMSDDEANKVFQLLQRQIRKQG